ncbi:prepilin-type N-terminal cleavage/methylation domain-containing protein [Agromyces terreus]|uniref:Prepilin-type N-terminal cleavage/methylation domain-containing protein n=1 Tax=Agromyces terreus TaxID=424795 RepID=A0A9X2H0R1_9MICO|nr:prepilin-type N-terminal cleavage/methylation domain-containing protein [Agromyces terreus]MCP2371086.1 prepilin-type N-terminal cleavage/methylation domain-containing protein [Agromyces terreus]
MIRGIRRRLASDDAGFSLVELLVAVILMGIVLTMIANIYIATVKGTHQAGAVHESTGNASNAANELGAVIRFATTNPRSGTTDPDPAILAATSTRLVLMATVGVSPTAETGGRPTKPTLIEFSRTAAGQLQERRWIPTASGSTWVFAGTDPTTVAPASVRLLGGTLTTGTALFTYYDAVGNPITTPVAGLNATQRAGVSEIGVRVSMVPPDDLTAAPVVITARIPLANLGLREPS